MKATATGIKRIINAFGYSCAGFKQTFKSEAAFRQDLALCAVLFVVSLFLNVTAVEWILMTASLFFILIMELINTAIESIIDRISADYHELSKKAKDIGSLLVLMSFVLMFIVWGRLLFSKFW